MTKISLYVKQIFVNRPHGNITRQPPNQSGSDRRLTGPVQVLVGGVHRASNHFRHGTLGRLGRKDPELAPHAGLVVDLPGLGDLPPVDPEDYDLVYRAGAIGGCDTEDGLCTSYAAIARVTAAPVGTVRSRLNRARARLADALMATAAGTPMSHASAAAAQRQQWNQFYRVLHERPIPRTYEQLFAPDVDVRDPAGHWHGINAWSAEEREAITVGIRATIVDVLASSDITILEIDFSNPAEWPDHCPPQATFVDRLCGGPTPELQINYPAEHPRSD